ncbi:MAG: class I mannose-6-phosphate isomerase [Solirubrobacteraceae bacterium]
MIATAQKLPPNVIARFYRGGPAIAALRGFGGAQDTPEEWIGSTTTAFGEAPLGLSRLGDGSLLRDAIAAEPEAWLGRAHVARFGPDPALLVKLLDAGERLPVHVHPEGPFAAEHLGTRFGKTEAWIVVAAEPGAQVHLGFREGVEAATLRTWTAEQDRDALLGALHPVGVAAGDALFVPAGVAHSIGAGVLIAELQEPTDLSIMLEWKGFGIADADEATLGLGWDVALACVERGARDPAALFGPRPDDALSELLPAAAARFFRAQRIAPGGGAAALGVGFVVIVVTEGAGAIAGLDVARGDALLVPHAAGDVVAEGDLVAIVCRPPEVGGG